MSTVWVEDTLKDRAHSYDTQQGQAWQLAGELIAWFQKRGLLNRILNTDKAFAWTICLVKLVRLAQDPDHADSWLDLSGYATLVLNSMSAKKESQDGTPQ